MAKLSNVMYDKVCSKEQTPKDVSYNDIGRDECSEIFLGHDWSRCSCFQDEPVAC